MIWTDKIMRGSSPRFRNHPGVTADGASAWQKNSLPKSPRLFFGETGAAAVTNLLWDTEQLGIPCGRIDALAARNELDAIGVIQAACDMARELGIDHLSCRCDSADQILVNSLLNSGFSVVDEIVTFALSLEEFEPQPTDASTRLCTEEDSRQVGRIAEVAFTVDRFHSDPLIPKAGADRLHAEWGRNSVKKIAADEVIVGVNAEGRVVGFVTCKLNRGTFETLGKFVGTIVLVATAPEAQGQGFGKKMVSHALNWFTQSGCDIVEVGTQLANSGAAKLYERAGFVQTDRSISLRKWLGTGTSVIQVAEESATIS